ARPRRSSRPPPQPPPPPPPPKPSKVHVIVFDGDTGAPVAKARVQVGRFAGRTDAKGVAKIRIARHVPLQVKVVKRGYDNYKQRLQFRGHPKVGVRVYQARLQWPLYGANPGRTQSHDEIRVRPPVRVVWSTAAGGPSRPEVIVGWPPCRVVWSTAVGGLMEFPAVVDADVSFVANYHASVRAYSMRNGKRAWRRDRGGIMASSPAIHGQDLIVHAMNGHVYVLDRHNGRIRWSYTTGARIECPPQRAHG